MKTAADNGPNGHAVETRAWPRGRWIWAGVAVVLLALTLRVAYVLEIRSIGFFDVPLSDALVYDERARGIVEGDWLGPAEFIHAPLYAFMLAAVRAAGFDSLLAPRLLQALLGALSCALMVSLSRRALANVRSRDAIALSAGLLLALYPPAIFFDGLIQKSSTVLFLSSLLLWLLFVAHDAQAKRWWLACGAALGLLILVRQNALALLPLLAVLACVGVDKSRKLKAMNIAAMAIGLAIVLSPWVVRHKIVLGEFFLSTPNLGQNFAMGNHPNATGTYLPGQRGRATGEAEHAMWKRAAEQDTGRQLTAAEISDYYLDASLAYIKANPGDWLLLTGKKVLMVLGAYELPDTEDYYLYKEHSRILRCGDWLLHFGVLGPLAGGGIMLTWQQWRRLWVLHAWLLINALAIAAFVVFARYRLPMLPVVLMFAAVALVHGAALLRARQWRSVMPAATGMLIAAVVMNWPVHSVRLPHAFSYVNHAVALADAGRHEDALAELEKAHSLEPGDVDAHWIHASILFDMQRFDESLEHYRAALAGDPTFGGAHRGIGTVLLAAGRANEAAGHFRSAIELDAHDHVSMNKLAVTHATRGEPLQALSLLEQAAAIEPSDAEVQLNLGNVHVALRQLDEAVLAYERALALRPRYFEAHLNLANVLAATGDPDSAIAHTRFALDVQPGDRQLLYSLVNLYVQAGRDAEALEFLRRRIDSGDHDLQQLFEALRDRRR